MDRRIAKSLIGCLAGAVGLVGLALGVVSCGTAPPPPFVVTGPGFTGNEPPTLTILEPTANLTRDQGSFFLIRWTDSDRDSNAVIGFTLVNTLNNVRVSLVQNLSENDTTGPDSVSVGTSPIPQGAYNLEGTIFDGENPPVSVFAMTTGTAVPERVELRIVPEGTGPPTVPPAVTVTEPAFNLSVTQDDVLRVAVQPSELIPNAANPFDSDSAMTLYILLDRDLDPNNDDPANPDPNEIILLQSQVIPEGAFEERSFDIEVDLTIIPPRPGGAPYFIRATADDQNNPRVHQYAVGTISVVELAAGLVDLAEIGKTKAGARAYGFNPGANTGSSINRIGDFDADGVADFVILAQFGNPRNLGRIGEGYLIYGQRGIRFGGSISVNAVSESISGVIFEAPPVRTFPLGSFLPGTPRSDGLTSVSFIRDLSGDGRPEIIIGMPHVYGAFESMDFDPADESAEDVNVDVEVELEVRQQAVTLSEGGLPIFVQFDYLGVDDLTISSAAPNANFGSEGGLNWQDAGAGQRQWALINFQNLLDLLPDSPATIDFASVQGDLELRVFNTGADGMVHVALQSFNEQTTYNTFAINGGDPQAGVDYVAEALGGISGDAAELVTVDVSDAVRLLLDRELEDDEFRLIIVPNTANGANDAQIRSSEFSTVRDRPTLRITYTRQTSRGAVGCYPDPYANNVTTIEGSDLNFTGGGMAVLINSQNRDNASSTGVNPLRLESTVVSLELVGQENWILDGADLTQSSGPIFVRADNTAAENLGNEPDEAIHISGARFMAGWFDFIDHLRLRQPPREDQFGQTVASIGDLNNDGLDEIVISAPRNERYLQDLLDTYGFQSTHLASTGFPGSIVVIPGTNYNLTAWREKNDEGDSASSLPVFDQFRFPHPNFGSCGQPVARGGPVTPADSFNVFAEDLDDMLGGAQSAGDFNQDGLDDLLCGAYLNDGPGGENAGAVYIIYGRNVLGDFDLTLADDSLLRPPMLRIRGLDTGDQIGWRQATGLDVNGDRIDDVFISSPRVDYGSANRSTCAGDFNGDSQIDADDLNAADFNGCQDRFDENGDDLFSDDACKVFDYDNDADIDADDGEVFGCLLDGGSNCCQDLVDNGFVGVIFGGVFTDGDRDISQIATSDLPGTIFHGSGALHRAGVDVSSAGDFNQDGFGDLLIAVPGETRLDDAGRQRLGVVYLVFGGTHLENKVWNLAQVGSADLPGIVFLSPYVKGRPNEAPPTTVAFLGDINLDGFGDIAIGAPEADFIDLSFPQGPNLPTDASVGRRRNAGDAYIVYGNNFGSNRGR